VTRRSSHRRDQMSGFSLLEMLVALVILSFSLGALYQSATGAIRNVAVADEYTRAVVLAESMLASAQYVSQEEMLLTGTFDMFNWQTTSWPVESANDSTQDAPVKTQPLQYLKVVVTWPGSSSDRQVSLLTVVPLQESPE
jgi:general secretion pathway protein I